jgi:hypothetical protein
MTSKMMPTLQGRFFCFYCPYIMNYFTTHSWWALRLTVHPEALEWTNGLLSLRLRLRPSLRLVRAYGSERGASAPEGEPLARRGQACRTMNETP